MIHSWKGFISLPACFCFCFPLFITSSLRCIKYWLRWQKQPGSMYSKKACLLLLFSLHEKGKVAWVIFIKLLVCSNGFGQVKPVLNWANVCSPNILRTLRRTMIRFLIELLVRRIWFGQSKLYFILNWLVMRCKFRPELAADAQQTA